MLTLVNHFDCLYLHSVKAKSSIGKVNLDFFLKANLAVKLV